MVRGAESARGWSAMMRSRVARTAGDVAPSSAASTRGASRSASRPDRMARARRRRAVPVVRGPSATRRTPRRASSATRASPAGVLVVTPTTSRRSDAHRASSSGASRSVRIASRSSRTRAAGCGSPRAANSRGSAPARSRSHAGSAQDDSEIPRISSSTDRTMDCRPDPRRAVHSRTTMCSLRGGRRRSAVQRTRSDVRPLPGGPVTATSLAPSSTNRCRAASAPGCAHGRLVSSNASAKAARSAATALVGAVRTRRGKAAPRARRASSTRVRHSGSAPRRRTHRRVHRHAAPRTMSGRTSRGGEPSAWTIRMRCARAR